MVIKNNEQWRLGFLFMDLWQIYGFYGSLSGIHDHQAYHHQSLGANWGRAILLPQTSDSLMWSNIMYHLLCHEKYPLRSKNQILDTVLRIPFLQWG